MQPHGERKTSEDREDKHERSRGSLDQDEMNSFLEGRRGREF
jgi:hypothetical protein